MQKIDFQVETIYGIYGDCILIPDGVEYTLEEINAIKEQRVSKWLDFIENPPPSLPDETIINLSENYMEGV